MNTVNVEQDRVWNGDDGIHWAQWHERYDAMAEPSNTHLFEAAEIGSEDRVLDIGCGTGQTTRLAARLAQRGHAVGIDLSEPMLVRARRTAAEEQIGSITFEQGDAQVFPFPSSGFEVAISRAGVMFFDDPVAAFGNIGKALVPGGRLAFLCHRDMDHDANPVLATLAEHLPLPDLAERAPGVVAFSDPEQVSDVLDAAGFVAVRAYPITYRTALGRDALDATDFLFRAQLRAFLTDIDEGALARARTALVEALRPFETDGAVHLPVGGWIYTGRTCR
ncbi:methyltransferase domain-containing protein [Nocardia uniformis]|uniref:Methyltransferase domain-containing protein n=2 Tax=Nocardia uniformis TaxID=53432 RepID=A0A849C4T2_9NOCA|nr:methyltransferase domain-containing protein [Nocardia uniformis]